MAGSNSLGSHHLQPKTFNSRHQELHIGPTAYKTNSTTAPSRFMVYLGSVRLYACMHTCVESFAVFLMASIFNGKRMLLGVLFCNVILQSVQDAI